MPSWRLSIPCTRREADRLLAGKDLLPGHAPALAAAETADGWELSLYCDEAPTRTLREAFEALVDGGALRVERLPETDWVTLSQAGLEPVDVGRFHVHGGVTAGRARPGQWPLRIPAGLAFGTGRHATTAGCLRAAQALAKRRKAGRILDVGTGSGILALATLRLHPGADVLAADIDPVSVRVARANARLNGAAPGRMRFVTAPGVAHPKIAAHAPYDLVFANILAGPLVSLAPAIASQVGRGGDLVLAGLLAGQARRVLAAYGARGFARRFRVAGEWPVLVLRQRRRRTRAGAVRALGRPVQAEGWRSDSV
jgi:ribosomal protein L11 methyltransferase